MVGHSSIGGALQQQNRTCSLLRVAFDVKGITATLIIATGT